MKVHVPLNALVNYDMNSRVCNIGMIYGKLVGLPQIIQHGSELICNITLPYSVTL